MFNLTATERAILTANNVTFTAGLELLNADNRVVDDITDDLVGGQVDYDNFTTVHGSCRLSITRRLAWGRDRVRPYVIATAGSESVRINQGVYILTTPREERAESPQTFDVTGYNLLHLLTDGPGDTYMVTAGTTYLQAARDVISAAGLTIPVRMDGTLQDTTLPATRTWCLTDSGTSWLSIVDDLLDEINYANLFCDRDGTYRSEPYMDPALRPSEHTFDTNDPGTNIVHHDRVVTEDVATAVNWWRFVRTGLEYQPFDGDGIYEPAVNATDPAQTALGRIVRRVVFLEAADQAALVAQGDRIVIEDTQVTRSVDLTIDPFPALGHHDVCTLDDGGVREKLPVASWSLSLTGEPGPLRLGGLPKPMPERREQQAKATVVTVSPLTVVVDGATVATPAAVLDGWTATQIGQRITATVRNPQPPLVAGEET